MLVLADAAVDTAAAGTAGGLKVDGPYYCTAFQHLLYSRAEEEYQQAYWM